jgi:RHS repeat-associated protein
LAFDFSRGEGFSSIIMFSITDDSGTLTSQQRYFPFGGMRELSGYSTSGLTDYTYTGQRTLDPGMGGLMDYKARFYSPLLGRFTQPDTLIPDPGNPQAWNRFSYVYNSPVNYSDPSGHVVACDKDDWACQFHWDMVVPPKKKAPTTDPKELAEDLHLERPVSGSHFGVSLEGGFLKGNGVYFQFDLIMDWRMGTLYKMGTFGLFSTGGTPDGLSGEIYGGTTNVHGIPFYGEEDISRYLKGKNIDAAISAGGDALVKGNMTKGLSMDVDESFKPVHTNAGLLGYQYSIENSLEIGINSVPNGLDLGVEGGGSDSWIIGNPYQIPWWPW